MSKDVWLGLVTRRVGGRCEGTLVVLTKHCGVVRVTG